MHTGMSGRWTMVVIVIALLGVGAVLSGGGIAVAQPEPELSDTCMSCPGNVPPGGGGPVTGTPEGLLGQVRAEVEELNSYEAHPVPCHGVDEDNDPGGEFEGHWRWRITRLTNESWHDVENTDPQSGTYYRRECWAPAAGEFGELDEVVLFANITPQNLAQLAMDDFFLGLPPPEARFNPSGPTLVGFDTWLWLERIPENSVEDPVESEVISVPGIEVQAFAWSSAVHWDMGDGSVVDCPDAGVPYVAGGPPDQTTTCSYPYQRSSAGQPEGGYQGAVSIVWTGRYTVNGDLADGEIPIHRSTPFTLAVEEAQALNTDG